MGIFPPFYAVQKSEGEGIIDLERELDTKVYDLYKLTKEEIRFIEESYS